MRPHEFAEQIGVSVEKLRSWDRTGKLKAKRTLVKLQNKISVLNHVVQRAKNRNRSKN